MGYLLEIDVETLRAAMFWNQVQYFGLPFVPAFWFLVCLLYTQRLHRNWAWVAAAVFAVPAITFVMRLTNACYGFDLISYVRAEGDSGGTR